VAHIPGTDRTQSVLLPEVVDDYVRPDNPVRFLDAFVAQLDLGALGFQRAVPAETGRPGYDPGDLLRLYLYGYLHRIRSSRRLEQETHRNVELMWLLRRLTPDFKTIADFRRDHPEALKRVGREFIVLCRQLELFGGELLAIDGSKFRAVNARDRSYTPARLATLQRDIDRTIARYLRELERQDEAEAGTEGPSAEALQEKIAALQQRRARYEALQQELAASGETARSLTDPDSRPMLSGGRIEVCYNVQTAVDAQHKLIVAETVTNAAGDRDQLSPMATAAQDMLGGATPVVVADQGYYHGLRSSAVWRRALRHWCRDRSPRRTRRGAASPKTISGTMQPRMSITVPRGRRSPTAPPPSSSAARSRTTGPAPVGTAGSGPAVRATKTGASSRGGWTSTCWRRWPCACGATVHASRSAKRSPNTRSAR
jgi:transposase